MVFEYIGKVEKVGKVQTFNNFKKLEIKVGEDEGYTGKYPTHNPFTLKQDKCDLAKSLRVGDRVKVKFVLDGREWTDKKTGETRCFAGLTAIGIDVLSSSGVKDLTPDEDDTEIDDCPF